MTILASMGWKREGSCAHQSTMIEILTAMNGKKGGWLDQVCRKDRATMPRLSPRPADTILLTVVNRNEAGRHVSHFSGRSCRKSKSGGFTA